MGFFETHGASDLAAAGKGKLTAKNTSQKLVAANRDRVSLKVYNAGAKAVFLALGTAAVADEGIYLKPEGGDEKISDFTGEVTAITKEGESLVTYVEI